MLQMAMNHRPPSVSVLNCNAPQASRRPRSSRGNECIEHLHGVPASRAVTAEQVAEQPRTDRPPQRLSERLLFAVGVPSDR